LLGAGLLGAATLPAQTFELNPLTTSGVSQNGFRIYDLSAYTSYSTVDSRWNNFIESLAGGQYLNLPNHTTLSGVSGAFGFHSGNEEGTHNFSVIYSPSYSYTTFGLGVGALTHTLALYWSVKLRPQWQFSATASGAAGNFEQLLFSPTSTQSLAASVSTVEGLVGVALTGQSSDPNAAAASAASATISPQQLLLYGDRMLSAVAQASLVYAHSPRFTVGFTISGNRMQHLVQGNGTDTQNYYLIPQTTDAAFATSLSYMLTERTSLTGSAGYGRSLSSLSDSQYATAQAGLGRKLSRRIFGQFAAGGGYILPVGAISTRARGSQWEGSGGIGYRGEEHVFIVAVNRSVSDFYGLGAAATLSSSLGWSWHRRGRRWTIQSGVGQDKMLGSQITALGLGNNGIRANAGLYWNVAGHASVGLQYAFVSYSGVFPVAGIQGPGQSLRFDQHSVRLNFGWGMAPGGRAPGANQAGYAAATP
jgi:hypothetical protein